MIGSFGGLSVPLSDFFCSFPLSLKVNGLGVPVFHLRRDHGHGHDLFH